MAFAKAVLQKMLLEAPSDEHFDVRLIIEGAPPKCAETVLRAHRIVLCTVSEVFRTMFASGLRDHAEGVVHVSDFTPAAVSEALSLIYGGELNVAARDWKLAGQVWDFGHRFRIEHVASLARSAALAQVSEDNCLRVFGFALYVNDDAAAEQLKTFIAEPAHFLRVVRSPEFSLSSYEVISNLRRPGAGSFVEPDILTYEKVWFDALMGWAAAGGDGPPPEEGDERAAKRQVRLQQALRLVDFSRMRTHELREAHRNDIASESPALAGMLVGILLSRAEKLESLNFEKDRDLEELSAAYQVALFGKNEADRNARLTSERLEKVTSGKLTSERRMGDEDKMLRRRSGAANVTSGGGGNGYPYVPSEHRLSAASYGQSQRRKHSNPSSSPIL